MSGKVKRWIARILMAGMCISCALPVYAATTKDKINYVRGKGLKTLQPQNKAESKE